MKARMAISSALVVLALSMIPLAAQAARFTVNVVDGNGDPIVGGFRWLVEEDNTHPVTPGQQAMRNPDPSAPTNSADSDTSLGFDFHASHAPVARSTSTGLGLQGEELDGSSVTVNRVRGSSEDKRRYYVSVLPFEGYGMGGASVLVDRGNAGSVTVVVQKHPLKTAQISVFVFEDNKPLNNAPDLPQERPLGGTDWDVVLFEAGGLYGISGGQVLQDAFGNPLGTQYTPSPDPLTFDPDPASPTTSVIALGDGVLHPDANGVVVIENLVPAKYGIQVVPPAGQGWIQTSTIEGTKTIDAWVKSNEPRFFLEFGPPGHHVFIGFVQKALDELNTLVGPGSASLSGTITNLHASRPPATQFHSGAPFPGCYVGLNNLAAGIIGEAVYVQECTEDSEFQIDGVPDGNYQLVVFDKNLDIIIALLGVTIEGGMCNGGPCALGDVPVFNWFGKVDAYSFFDENENGYWDTNEVSMSADSTALNLRFRNGQVYQSFPVDIFGNAPFDEVFPFFKWLVMEWDFATLKATGATFIVDAGGALAPGEITNPLEHPDVPPCSGDPSQEECTHDGGFSTTVIGPALTQGFQVVLGQANVIEWGKGLYGSGENGGISGLVINTVTRAEDDPRYAANEEWEALVPRAQVVLYQDDLDNTTGLPIFGGDGIIDDRNGNGVVDHADVDNYPLGWGDPDCVDDLSTSINECARGREDINNTGPGGTFDLGDAIDVTWSDSWDDNKPTGCAGSNGQGFTGLDCFDGLRNFNQARPALFDGGYAFGPRYDCTADGSGGCVEGDFLALGADGHGYLSSGQYIVQGIAPPGYEHIKEEDRNVDFGDLVIPQALPPICVGELHLVPPFMSMVTDSSGLVCKLADGCVGFEAPFAGMERPLCDQKTILLSQGKNAALDFHLMTDVPKAARVVGFILDDNSNEFDPNSPNFGEKWAPPWLPVSFHDFDGVEIGRTYGDEFGNYNALLPSTFSANVPMPSGMGPNMLTACMNSAVPIPNPDPDPDAPPFITDPFRNSRYSQFCYTFQYMPGSTTYLDTPVIPIAAFAAGDEFPLDCEYDTGTPMITSVERRANDGGGGPFVNTGEPGRQQLVIRSPGMVQVPNPAFYKNPDGTDAAPRTIGRNYGFGSQRGTVALVPDSGGAPVSLTIPGASNNWRNRRVRANVPNNIPVGTYQLVVTKGGANPKSTPMGVTVTVGTGLGANELTPTGGNVWNVNHNPSEGDFTSIQAAIDSSLVGAGDLVLVAPGIYEELVILYKPIALQGWGAGSVTINGIKAPAEKLEDWRAKMAMLLGPSPGGSVFPGGLEGIYFDLLPGQETGFNASDNEPDAFTTGEGPVILVMAHKDGGGANDFMASLNPRIDGFTVTGADDAGGVFVNGYADGLQISNNRVASNAGWHGGGVRIGHASLTNQIDNNVLVYSDGDNDGIKIHHNQIVQNGSIGGTAGAGGGVALFNGSDDYEVTDNLICGNYANADGAGIGHRGLSENGLISRNQILFNQSFNQGNTVSGGGIFIGGGPAPMPLIQPLSEGSGSVKILSNLIQGNQAGAGDGGGIRTALVNGQDVDQSPTNASLWHSIDVFNNIIVNNVAGLAGGGLSLQDTINIRITNNTIAHNDSTATAGEAFMTDPNQSDPQPAGLVSYVNSNDLQLVQPSPGAFGLPGWATSDFSQPHLFDNNIFWENRSFEFFNDDTLDPPFGLRLALAPDGPYNDLEVLGAPATGLAPTHSVFTAGSPWLGGTNTATDPQFIADYVNGDRGQTILVPEVGSSIVAQPAFDEGGNFIDVRFGPLSLNVEAPLAGAPSDYHLSTASAPPVIGGAETKSAGAPDFALELQTDIDSDARTTPWDIGADER